MTPRWFLNLESSKAVDSWFWEERLDGTISTSERKRKRNLAILNSQYNVLHVIPPPPQSAVADDDDPSSKEVDKLSCAVDGIARKMEGIREEVTGIEKVGWWVI